MEGNLSKSKKRKWKEVTLDNPTLLDVGMEGFVSLEVLEDYTMESVLEENSRVTNAIDSTDGGKKSKKETSSTDNEKKRKKKKKKLKKESTADKEKNSDDKLETEQEKNKDKCMRKVEPGETQGKTYEMSDWTGLGVPSEVLKALHDKGFTKPTTIQELAIPPAIFHHRDIIGAAETGSGKTLAFGIPIIHHIMAFKEHSVASTNKISEDNQRENKEEEQEQVNKNPLLALIMTPTRELALQIKEHLTAALKYTSLKVAAVVGGMAAPKQQRLLKKHPEIVVATPGRLWEIISMQEEHMTHLESLRYLVIDEADRMIEQGHFKELTSILDLIHQKKSESKFDSCFRKEDMKIKKKQPVARLQKFIFSATLTLPKSFKTRGKEQKCSREELLVSLMDKMNMEKKKSKVIDVTTKKGTVLTLTEAKITCSKDEKDIYLYYFLLKYPGRTLVFTNTIDCIRRLASILRLLQLNPLPLHANMQQRQRLKNLDRFRSSKTGLLVATDVAARGLDIPSVQHVIHYQVPKDPEVYIHRSGRTARALAEGLSVVLVGPEDLVSYRKIMKTLNNGKDLESFPLEIPYLKDVKSRVLLARQIDKEENKVQKKKSSNDWFMASAKAMDIEVDEDLMEDLGDSRERKLQQKKIEQMKASLLSMIKKPLVPKGFNGKFPTQTGKLIVPGLQDESSNSNQAAVEEVKKKKRRR